MTRTALATGGASGIGAATAKLPKILGFRIVEVLASRRGNSLLSIPSSYWPWPPPKSGRARQRHIPMAARCGTRRIDGNLDELLEHLFAYRLVRKPRSPGIHRLLRSVARRYPMSDSAILRNCWIHALIWRNRASLVFRVRPPDSAQR